MGYQIGTLIAIHTDGKETIFFNSGSKGQRGFLDGDFKQLEP